MFACLGFPFAEALQQAVDDDEPGGRVSKNNLGGRGAVSRPGQESLGATGGAG